MFNFLKRILGLPTDEEVIAAKNSQKEEPVADMLVVNNKTGDLVEQTVVSKKLKEVVNPQITDAVTQAAPTLSVVKVKKPRKTKSTETKKEKAVEQSVVEKKVRKARVKKS